MGKEVYLPNRIIAVRTLIGIYERSRKSYSLPSQELGREN
jgi:hypothetical protein